MEMKAEKLCDEMSKTELKHGEMFDYFFFSHVWYAFDWFIYTIAQSTGQLKNH